MVHDDYDDRFAEDVSPDGLIFGLYKSHTALNNDMGDYRISEETCSLLADNPTAGRTTSFCWDTTGSSWQQGLLGLSTISIGHHPLHSDHIASLTNALSTNPKFANPGEGGLYDIPVPYNTPIAAKMPSLPLTNSPPKEPDPFTSRVPKN